MAKQPKASVGVAIIARNAEKTLPACLASLKQWVQQVVVCVDESSTDKTSQVAKRYSAEVHRIKVSDYHECPRHGRVLAQHFAEARNKSFSFLRKDLTWWMWLDADDTLQGGERLAQMLAGVPDGAVGVWLPYHYSALEKDGVRAVNTSFYRERVLRANVGWRWEHRVHEVVVPDAPGPWLTSDIVKVAHQTGAHKAESSAARNQLLLEIDLEENPNDPRATFYMANGFFAVADWERAAAWYERYTEIGQNHYELWQSYVYMSMAYQRLGDLNAAVQAAYGAIDVEPRHPEPYIQLEHIYLAAGEAEKAEYWAKEAAGKEDPPFFVFTNPMDKLFNLRVGLADAYAQQGRIGEARQVLEAAYKVFPEERVGKAIEHYREIESAERTADAFGQLADLVLPQLNLSARYIDLSGSGMQPFSTVLECLDLLPPTARELGRVRDRVAPLLMRTRPTTQPRIIFFCGKAYEPWGPPSLNTTGIGGSETAVVEIARRFAVDGWRVDVYNEAGRYEGIHEGVGYWDLKRLGSGERCEVLAVWRNPALHALPVEGRVRLLWVHDLNYGPEAKEAIGKWDAVLGVSAWHARMLSAYYGITNADYVPNGVNLERFDPSIKKVGWRCVYASSADRGLLTLLSLWPRIVENEPGAELHVAYGWQTFDRMAAGRPDMQAFKAAVMQRLETTPQVVWRDRLGQAELAKLYGESYAWLYPTNFLEVSCISAMEAMAGGAVPVVTRCGALPETIGNAGVLVDIPRSAFPAQPTSPAWQDNYVNMARAILADPNLRNPMAIAGRNRAKELTWDRSYEDRWKPKVARLLEGRAVACE